LNAGPNEEEMARDPYVHDKVDEYVGKEDADSLTETNTQKTSKHGATQNARTFPRMKQM